MTDASWIKKDEETAQEAIDTALAISLEESPREWPIYRDGTWNPGGHPLSPYPTERNADIEPSS